MIMDMFKKDSNKTAPGREKMIENGDTNYQLRLYFIHYQVSESPRLWCLNIHYQLSASELLASISWWGK